MNFHYYLSLLLFWNHIISTLLILRISLQVVSGFLIKMSIRWCIRIDKYSHSKCIIKARFRRGGNENARSFPAILFLAICFFSSRGNAANACDIMSIHSNLNYEDNRPCLANRQYRCSAAHRVICRRRKSSYIVERT